MVTRRLDVKHQGLSRNNAARVKGGKRTLNIVARQVLMLNAQVRKFKLLMRRRLLLRQGRQSARNTTMWHADAGCSGVCTMQSSLCCSEQNIATEETNS